MTATGAPRIESCPVCGGAGRLAWRGRDLLMGLPGVFDYAECEDCGAVYQTPMPDAERIAAFYPEGYTPHRPAPAKAPSALERSVLAAARGYRHLEAPLPAALGRLLGLFLYRDAIPFTGGGRLLDVGCGGGRFLRAMRLRGWEVRGVEFDAGAVESCRADGLEVFHGDLAAARFPDASFDVVTARHLVEHLPDPRGFVREVHRILRPGGLMALRTPNSRALGRRWFGAHWFANDVPRHLVLFSPENLVRLAGEAGFEPVRLRTASTPKILLNSWDYRFGVKGRPSRKRRLRRLLARPYVAASMLLGRGDEIIALFRRPGDDGAA